MLLVDDYGYEEMTGENTEHTIDGIKVKPEISWTDFLVCYWLIVGAIIILNLFIGELLILHLTLIRRFNRLRIDFHSLMSFNNFNEFSRL